jgi:hypothetical protein
VQRIVKFGLVLYRIELIKNSRVVSCRVLLCPALLRLVSKNSFVLSGFVGFSIVLYRSALIKNSFVLCRFVLYGSVAFCHVSLRLNQLKIRLSRFVQKSNVGFGTVLYSRVLGCNELFPFLERRYHKPTKLWTAIAYADSQTGKVENFFEPWDFDNICVGQNHREFCFPSCVK